MATGLGSIRARYIPAVIASLVVLTFPLSQAAVAQQTWTLPAPWNAQDVGAPAIAGSATFDQSTGTFGITAAGAGIGGRSDQFTFIYQQVTGDVEVIARVDSVTAASAWSKSGVMIRSSLAADAAHAYALVSAGHGVAFQRRLNNAGSSTLTYGPAVSAPYWVRLVRKGTTLTSYSSTDGTTWATLTSRTVSLGATAYVGIATTSHNTAAATTAAVSHVSIVPLSLPAPQKAADVGAPSIAGSTTYAQGVYRVHAGGTDIGGTSDQFHFVYQPMSGDSEVVARVQALSNSDAWAKTGVMIRESLAPDSRHAFALLSAGSGYAFERRIDPAGITQQTNGPAGPAPGWVRLVRSGAQIDAFASSDGTNWTSIGSDVVPMADAVLVGIATTSHNATTATDAVLDSFKVTAATPAPNQPPSVAVTSPADGSTFTAGNSVVVNAAANDSDGTVARVDFFAGTTQIGSSGAAPYSVTWSAAVAGTYSLTAVAIDNDGASTTSAAVSIRVTAPANQAPNVTLTAPSSGATFTAPATVPLSANATDSDGTIARVEFYNGTTLLNSDTTAPYAYSWANVAAGTYGIRAVAYDNAGASATSATATITVTAGSALPTPWTAVDVGAPALSGSTAYSNGVFSVGAAGVDIWGTSDQFQFVYQPVDGDVEIVARVDSLSGVDPYTNAGVMIRGSLQPGSLHGYSTLTGSNGVYFRRRTSDGGTTTSIQVAGVTAPTWVRLVRSGTLVTSSWSTDGSTWSVIGSQTLALGTTAYVGLAVSSHNANTRTTAQFSNVRVAPAAVNQSPTVTLTSPASGATFTAPATVTLSANATDSDGTIARVEFYNGTTLLNSDAAAPYSFTWSSVAAGTYTLKAIAYDNGGASGSSATVSVTVSPAANQAPTVTLTAPSNGTTFTAPATVTLSANATDSDGTIARVEFYSGTTLLNTDTTVPYSFVWSAVAAGTYTVKAMAYDNAGASASSSTATITVASGSGLPAPWTAVDIGSPALSGSTTYSNGVFSIAAAGADIWGTSDQFQFVYQPVDGDVEIVARVDSLTAVDPYTNAGVMIRGSLQPGSLHGYSTLTGSNGVYFRRRTADGGTTTSIQVTAVTAPTWVRLVRSGTLVTSSWSTDGSTWSVIGSQTLPLGTTAYVGLAVSSHNATTRTTAQFSNVRLGAAPANQPPAVTLTSPASGTTFTAPATVTLSANATDSDGTIARVEFYNGTTLLNSDTTAPYSFTWSSVAAGTYTVKAIAYDNRGASTASAVSTITVNTSTTTPPTGVVFTASPDHATLVTSYELRVYASGADPNTATPIATSNLGKPTPDANNDITVSQPSFFSALAPGNYVAAVAAIGSGGSSLSTAVSFTR